ncbi:hypothetical protein GW17_00005520 [Ensete ventricosum]|nr:hypothetical protein GW17_00005520 [Ensete ventricosum]RZS29396.1 hypothetical protein BHM03_00063125 [Ensete ventricosum]
MVVRSPISGGYISASRPHDHLRVEVVNALATAMGRGNNDHKRSGYPRALAAVAGIGGCRPPIAVAAAGSGGGDGR